MTLRASLLLGLVLLVGCASAQPQSVNYGNLKSMQKLPAEKTLTRASCRGGDYLSWNPSGGYWQCSGGGLSYPSSQTHIGGKNGESQ